MQISYACEAAPAAVANDDFILATENFVIVLDGATANGMPTGCSHDVPWVASQLAGQLATILIGHPGRSLVDVVREGIEGLRGLHDDTCDLANPDSPSTTVALVRTHEDRLDYLVLADSPVIIERRDGQIIEVLDDRNLHLPARDRASVSSFRNSPDGFWVASTRPEAADHAVTGTVPLAEVRRFAVMTDGLSRLAERFGWTWSRLLDLLESEGPGSALQAVREAERRMQPGTYRGKQHDDATVAFCSV